KRKLYDEAIKQAYEGEIAQSRTSLADSAEKRANIAGELVASQENLRNADAELARYKAQDHPKEPQTEAEIALAYQAAMQKGDKLGDAKYKGALDMLAKQKAAGKDTSAADLAKYIQVSENRARRHQAIDDEQQRDEAQQAKEREAEYGKLDKDF